MWGLLKCRVIIHLRSVLFFSLMQSSALSGISDLRKIPSASQDTWNQTFKSYFFVPDESLMPTTNASGIFIFVTRSPLKWSISYRTASHFRFILFHPQLNRHLIVHNQCGMFHSGWSWLCLIDDSELLFEFQSNLLKCVQVTHAIVYRCWRKGKWKWVPLKWRDPV